MLDLLIAGAGPAGLACALHAERAGLQVAVTDPRSTPIDKACGEGLMPGAVRRLRGLGVEVSGHAFHGIRYLDGDRQAEATFDGDPGLGAARVVLQAGMAAAVLARGIPIHREAVAEVHQTAAFVEAAGRRARFLVAADGLHSPISRALGLTPTPARHPRFGIRRHFQLAPWSDLVEVHWARDVEAYVTPLGPNLVGVALLGAPKGGFDERLSQFPALLERLQGAPGDLVRGAGPLLRRVPRRVCGRVLLVGDAAGYVEALTGEGINTALACAEELVRAVAIDRPDDYERAWHRATRRYRWLTRGLLVATRPQPLRRRVVPAAARFPGAFAGVVRQLAD